MDLQKLGQALKQHRLRRGINISDLARLTGKDRSYLSKIENGHEKPSPVFLDQLLSSLEISKMEASYGQLFQLAGYIQKPSRSLGKEVNIDMTTSQEEIKTNNHDQAQINIDPKAVPVLYTDSAFVTSSQWGIVLDFAQTMGPTNQQNVVARVGMSREHAKALLKLIEQHAEPNNIKNVKLSGGKN